MANKIVVGVSGGPDSMNLLYKLRRKKKRLIVAHVNYNFRPDSIEETEIIIDFCRKHNIEFRVLNVDEKVLERYKVIKNIQSKARKIRFDFFEQLAKTYETKTVMLGHHKNDFIETAIMQDKRSQHLLFYGINRKVRYGNIVIKRPLLNKYKDAILAENKRHGIPYKEDSSNFDTKYERNEIRAKLDNVPKKKHDIMYKNFVKVNKSREQLDRKITRRYNSWEELEFAASYFNALDKDTKRHSLYRYFIREEKLFKINMNKVLGAIQFIEKKGNGKFRLAEDLSLQIREGKIRVIEEK